MNIRLQLVLFYLFSLSCITVYAQNSIAEDSVKTHSKKKNFLQNIYSYFDESNHEKKHKRFDVSFIGGPHYSSDVKLGLGLVASGLYYLDKNNESLSPSNVSLYSDITTSGSYAIGIGGNTIFKDDNYRLDFDLFFSSMPSRYWGVGYNKGKYEKNYSKYTKQEIQFKVDFYKKIVKNTYLGVTLGAQDTRSLKIKEKSYFQEIKRHYLAIGGGLILSYDTRDFVPNPYKGVLLKLEYNYYPQFLGSSHDFNRTEFTARYYKQMWEGAVLAFDFQGTFNDGKVPASMVALMGSSYRMRGYYKGQYRDEKLMQTQVELRQKIYGRSGAVVWAGAGNVFPNFDKYKWNQTLSSFGVGYRWEFKKRVNVRLDYGIGRGQSSFYFNINEAF